MLLPNGNATYRDSPGVWRSGARRGFTSIKKLGVVGRKRVHARAANDSVEGSKLIGGCVWYSVAEVHGRKETMAALWRQVSSTSLTFHFSYKVVLE